MNEGSDSVVVRVDGLTVAAGGVDLLREVSFTLSAGRLLGICGPSGCGKTTLLRCLNGLTDPAAGTVEFHGRPVGAIDLPRFRRRMILLHQRPVLADESVRGNLARPFEYAAARREFPLDAACTLLDELGVGSDRIDRDARRLSLGQQQRVCLVRALLCEPEVLLMDEPTSALDAESVSAVEQRVRREADRRGLSGVIVSHDRRQAERLCETVLDLDAFGVEGAS